MLPSYSSGNIHLILKSFLGFTFIKIKKNYGLFYRWDSTALKLQSHYEEAIYLLPLSSQKFLVIILSTSEG